jgi:hypothetical protein
MDKWLAGVAATVVATVVTAFVTNWFGIGAAPTPEDVPTSEVAPNRAVARIVAFNQSGSRVGQLPAAEITVENRGKKTAENCIVHWRSGIVFASGLPQAVASQEFPLQASQSLTVRLFSPIRWTAGGLASATAWIACSNTTSPVRPKAILVLAS